MIKQLKHLLPSGQAWKLTKDKPLKRLLSALGSAGDDAVTFADGRYADLFPSTTTMLEEWGEQFGVPATVEAVDTAWKTTGGQSKSYIESILHANGFDLYLHQFWEDGTEPTAEDPSDPIVRNPNDFLNSDNWYGRPLFTAGDLEVSAGNPEVTAGATLQAGEGPGYLLLDGVNDYTPLDNPTRWPYYVYVGAQQFPNRLFVSSERRAELENLLLKLIPAQQWIGVLVTYYPDWYDANGQIICGATLSNCKKVIPCL